MSVHPGTMILRRVRVQQGSRPCPDRQRGVCLTDDQFHLLNTAIADLYDTVLQPDAWPRAMRALATVFDASTSLVFRYEFGPGRVCDSVSHGFDLDVVRRYAEHYVHVDPATPVVLRAPAGRWLGDELLLDLHNPAHQEYLIDFALPGGIGRVGGGQIAASPHECLYFGVQRHPGAPRFGDEARRRFDVLAPHLARATALRSHMAGLAAGQALGQAMADTWAAALCVVDRQGRLRLANRAARRLLQGDAPLVLRGGGVVASRARDRDWLALALAAACQPQGVAGSARLPRADAAALQALVLPLPAAHELALGHDGPLALLIVSDPAQPHLSPHVLKSLFGLTAAESELLSTLVAGGNVAEHAARQGIAITTARTHAAALLAKTGVDSQVRLVALAKTLPSPTDGEPSG